LQAATSVGSSCDHQFDISYGGSDSIVIARNKVTKQSVTDCFTGYEIASLAAPDILSSRGTRTSLYIGRFGHPVLPRHSYLPVHRARNDAIYD
jgi:hypothetical protein